LLLILGVVVYFVWGRPIAFTIITMITVLYILISVGTGFSAVRKKYSPGWYFIIGNGALCVTLLVQTFHLLPSFVLFGYITYVQVGTLVQVSMFSLGLAKRLSVIRDDREKSQEEVISQLKINEELKTKVNRELEQKVSERTIELSEQKKIVEERNKDILDSITYARRLQQAILPSDEMWKSGLAESFIFYHPKDIVAGDFYWMEKRENIVFVAAADCTGHGVPGAMVSVVCSNALNRAFIEFGIDDPGILLDKVRELVLDTFAKSMDQVKDGMDISLARIDLSSREIKWAGANNPLWYVSEGMVNEIKANKQPIGVTDNPSPFTTHTIQLNSGDLIYLFTDGFADQFGGPKGKKFKYKPLQELVLSMAALRMEEQRKLLERTLSEWRGNLEQIDDVCIIGIRM
jgi:serine phosphatase RsbU (regulator of sigma subunit)